jgi:hypothetical protein
MTPMRNTSPWPSVISSAKRGSRADHFEKLLEVTCPNHAYPVWHKLKECSMIKNYMTMAALPKSKEPEDNPSGKAVMPFPVEEVVMSIYTEPVPHESRRKLKLTSQAVKTVSLATPEYLHWSEFPITFDRTDHPNNVPEPRRFPLIVDPLVKTTRLTKVLMDGAAASTSFTSIPSRG